VEYVGFIGWGRLALGHVAGKNPRHSESYSQKEDSGQHGEDETVEDFSLR
jgi:hypothetical protein